MLGLCFCQQNLNLLQFMTIYKFMELAINHLSDFVKQSCGEDLQCHRQSPEMAYRQPPRVQWDRQLRPWISTRLGCTLAFSTTHRIACRINSLLYGQLTSATWGYRLTG